MRRWTFPIPVPRPRISLSAREAFLYLLQFSTLYTVAYNLGRLLFQFVNRALPDAADGPYQFTGAAIRWSVSALIVAFPVFMFVSSVNARAVRANPAIRGSAVRRWLTYVTLFGAACTLIGDVMSLVYSALGGELTTRFVLKVADRRRHRRRDLLVITCPTFGRTKRTPRHERGVAWAHVGV